MGFIDFLKSMKIYEWVNFVFFLISLAMLIVGSVAIGMMYANMPPPMPPFVDIPTTTPAPPALPVIMVTVSLATGVSWSNDLKNSSSDAFQVLATSIQKNISTAWTQPTQAPAPTYYQLIAVLPPLSQQITAFSQGSKGVNFYSQFVFSDPTTTTSVLENALGAVGYMTNAFVQSTSLCTSVVPPSLMTTAVPATTTPCSISTTSALM